MPTRLLESVNARDDVVLLRMGHKLRDIRGVEFVRHGWMERGERHYGWLTIGA